MSNFLFELTVPDIKERIKKCDVIVIPMGSCEKHGPHCPVGVDSTTTYTIATRGANKANVLYTPVIFTSSYGKSK
jgi:creatinine amidohydrolase